jgi:hypothetical protein
MGLEVAGFISELVATNPVGAVDDYATADDHLRLIKAVLQAQFPNLTAGAVNPTQAELNLIVGLLATSAELNILDGALLSVAELNILNGALLSTAELNILNGVTAVAADLNILAGADAAGLTAAELLFVNGVTSAIQIQLDSKPAIIHGHVASDITSGTFADARISESSVTQHQGAIDHDALSGFVANEHIDWTAVGGEDIQEDRILLATETVVGGLEVATQAEADAGILDTKIITPAKLSASVGEALGETKVKTADKDITSNTSEEDDNHLAGWALDVNSIYMVHGFLYYEQDGGNFRFGFSISAGFHADDVLTFTVSDASALHLGATVDLQSGSVIVGPADNQRTGMTLDGFIQTHATIAATVSFEWAQSTSDPDPTTLKAGSWITFTKIAQL